MVTRGRQRLVNADRRETREADTENLNFTPTTRTPPPLDEELPVGLGVYQESGRR